MTISLIASCPKSGQVGSVVASSSIAVASRCSFTRTGVGAVQSQNVTDPALGPILLDLVADGATPGDAISTLAGSESSIEWRQLGLVDVHGRVACFNGCNALGLNAIAEGENCAALGNLLENPEVVRAMVEAFVTTEADFASRLLTALEIGLAAGGEAGPIHSAGLQVSASCSWPTIDLRVDWEDKPDHAIPRLREIWDLYQPQMQAYITRAVDPSSAEPYGVPGDEI